MIPYIILANVCQFVNQPQPFFFPMSVSGSFIPAEFSDTLTHFFASGWPTFIWNDPALQHFWPLWFRYFPEYQYEFRSDNGQLLACVHTVPLRWDASLSDLPDGRALSDDFPTPSWETAIYENSETLVKTLSGWDWAMTQSLSDVLRGRSPNLLSAAATVVSPAARGQGLASQAVDWMKEIASQHGLQYLIAPLRPSHKRDFPFLDFIQYGQKTKIDVEGRAYPYDPWLRLHVKKGGRLIHPCFRSIRIRQPLPVWKSWVPSIEEELTKREELTNQTRRANEDLACQIPLPEADSPLLVDWKSQTGYYSASGMWCVHEIQRK